MAYQWYQKAADQKDPDASKALERLKAYKAKLEAAAKTAEYKVASGDCLWTIARHLFSKGTFWRWIFETNQGQIKDPSLIHTGQTLLIREKISL